MTNKHLGKTWAFFVGTTAAALMLVAPAVRAQQNNAGTGPAAPPAARVSVSAQDKKVREVLLDLFARAGVSDYSLANDISGTVTLRLTDQPFEQALTLITRAVTPPLTWRKTDGVYEVKVRQVAPRDPEPSAAGVAAEPPIVLPNGAQYDMVYPAFTDARDLVRALEALQPEGLTAAFAYLPTNGLLLRTGGPGPLVTGVIGDGPAGGNLPAGGNAGNNGLGNNNGGGNNGGFAPGGNIGGNPAGGGINNGRNNGRNNGGNRGGR